MKQLNLLALACTGLLCGAGTLFADVVVAKQADVEALAQQLAGLPAAGKVSAAPLVHKNMEIIDTFFSIHPNLMISLRKAAAGAKKTLQMLPSIQETDVPKAVADLLKPVESSLSMLSGEASAFIEPLMLESLGLADYEKSLLAAVARQQGSAGDFLRAKLTTKQTLMAFCKDFKKFTEDLWASLTEATRKKIDAATKALIAKNRQAK